MSTPMAGRLVALCLVAAWSAAPAAAAERDDLFQEALRLDLGGSPDAATKAFDLYRRAGEAGLAEAQFNVGVMLDTGRGVAADRSAAAIWYARAAANGNRRAAYNLGLLYQSGEGVPRNAGLARLWFTRSGLPAGRMRLAALRQETPAATVSAPILSAPPAGARLGADAAAVELIWTAGPEPAATRFFVEARDLTAEPPRTLMADFVDATSVALPLPADARAIEWRVLAVDGVAGLYRATPWSRIVRGADETPPVQKDAR
jgi:hypothetical protein